MNSEANQFSGSPVAGAKLAKVVAVLQLDAGRATGSAPVMNRRPDMLQKRNHVLPCLTIWGDSTCPPTVRASSPMLVHTNGFEYEADATFTDPSPLGVAAKYINHPGIPLP